MDQFPVRISLLNLFVATTTTTPVKMADPIDARMEAKLRENLEIQHLVSFENLS